MCCAVLSPTNYSHHRMKAMILMSLGGFSSSSPSGPHTYNADLGFTITFRSFRGLESWRSGRADEGLGRAPSLMGSWEVLGSLWLLGRVAGMVNGR